MKRLEIKYLNPNSSKGFKLLAGINREIIPSHVTKIAKSLDVFDMSVRSVVITTISFLDGKPTTYILDGQHLFTACLRLNCEIPYCEVEVKDLRDLIEKISLLNSSSKSWSLRDYINSWKNVNKNYIKLEEFYQRYDIELCQLSHILHNGYAQPERKNISNVLKSGQLEVKNEKASIQMLDRVTDVLKIVPRMDRFSNIAFITAFSMFTLTPGYNHSETLKYLKANKSKLMFVTQDPEEYSKFFYDISKSTKKTIKV